MAELPTIAKAAERLRSGDLTPTDLVSQCLANIKRYDDKVRAWVSVDEEGAPATANRLVALFGTKPEIWPPLFGIPVGIKDIIDVAGWPTRCGSPLRGQTNAQQDAPVVAALRQAGAIILGKTVTTEFASFDPPPTRNPWNLERTPGGSSSGSAAAVALEMCCAALGTQTGGSIVRPAAFCGIAGFKPPHGAISLEGIEPFSPHLDHVGPMARTVEDLYLVWQALAQHASTGIDAAVTRPWSEQGFQYWLDCHGVNSTLFVAEGALLERVSPDVQAVCNSAIEKLRGSLTVKPLELPRGFERIIPLHRKIMAVDAALHHRAAFPGKRSQFGPNIASLMDEGLATPAVEYAEAMLGRQPFRQALARTLEQAGDMLGCLVMPSTVTTALDLPTTGDPAFNSPWSYLGLPSITIPCGLASDGMPCGLQFVALTVPQVFAMSGICERVLRANQRPPLLDADVNR
jgi:Asp-tRNA(Asn)/Glu-tRNA(Gln) amidotransferase A subunit family amidase